MSSSASRSLVGSAMLSVADMNRISEEENRKTACQRIITAVDEVISYYERNETPSADTICRFELARENFQKSDPNDLAHKTTEKVFNAILKIADRDSVTKVSTKITLLKTLRLAATKHQVKPVRPELPRVKVCEALMGALKNAEKDVSRCGGLSVGSFDALGSVEKRMVAEDIKDPAHHSFLNQFRSHILTLVQPRRQKDARLQALKKLQALAEKHQQTPVAAA